MRRAGFTILTALALLAQAEGETRGIRTVSVKDSSGQTIDLYDKSCALLVGVSKYTAGWPNLPSVPDELALIEDLLRTNGFITVKVIDPNSTELKQAFENFIARYGYDKKNRLLFIYSGHGWSRKQGEQGYLVPSDAPDPRQNEKEFLRLSLNMTRVLAWCKEMDARHALFLFDSCFSGSIFKTRALPETPPHITALTAKPVRQFITAGDEGQEVPAKSVFAKCLLRGLSGEADLSRDGYITGTELGMYLHDKVIYYKTGQTPQYGKMRDPDLDEGDFVFLLGNHAVPTTDAADLEPLIRKKTTEVRVLTYNDGRRYDGDVVDGIKSGRGTFTWPSGMVYVGEFRNDLRSGQGTLTWPNGNKYTGEWKDDKRNGQGVFTGTNGHRYAGNYLNDNAHGKGSVTYADGQKYTGEFANDMRSGQGTYIWPNGQKYVGEFRDGKMNGQGTYTWPNGDKYVGEWRDDKRNGEGVFTRTDGHRFSGNYLNGNAHGRGTCTYSDGHKYTGDFVDDVRCGQGTYTWPNGEKYVGGFKDGKLNGQGVWTDAAGYRYEGEYKDDKRNGQGTLTLPNGTRKKGFWVNGELQENRRVRP